jgi:hypothetical protein
VRSERGSIENEKLIVLNVLLSKFVENNKYTISKSPKSPSTIT